MLWSRKVHRRQQPERTEIFYFCWAISQVKCFANSFPYWQIKRLKSTCSIQHSFIWFLYILFLNLETIKGTIYSFEDLLYAYVMKTITFCNSAFPSDATYFILSHYSVNPEAFIKKKHEWKLSILPQFWANKHSSATRSNISLAILTWWESKVTPIFCHAFKTRHALLSSLFPIS